MRPDGPGTLATLNVLVPFLFQGQRRLTVPVNGRPESPTSRSVSQRAYHVPQRPFTNRMPIAGPAVLVGRAGAAAA